jgi:ATP/maltotriose-dependent transcriptional regulator MalT/DNA-binding SARP family transcriptional activator
MPILLTKVRPPQRRKDILRRVRLVDALHQNLHRKLTFVSAPAGYGKTTLLVDFAADVDAIVFWYRIGPEDNDLVQFVHHLIASFQQKVPRFARALEERLNTIGGTPDAASLAIDIINEVEQRVEDFSLLILDDYHLAGENQQIVDFIENLLEHLPDRLRILIGSRSVYGIPTASLYVRDELVTISADELRFRPEELQKLVLQNYRMRLSDEQAEEFSKRADGWIVAILLALRTMENGVLPKLSGGITKIYEYLAEEVVNRQSAELRDFMLATSILNDFNEAQCNFLLEQKDSLLFLRALEDRNLFVSRTETKEGVSYRYHQLFSEFLQDYFARNQADRLQQLHRRAASWHQKRAEWEAAIHHKLAAGDKVEAAAWIDEVAGKFYASDRPMLLANWLAVLSKAPDARRHAPRLLLYQAKTFNNQGSVDASLKLLKLAEPVLRKQNDPETLANALVTKGMAYRVSGKHKEARKLAVQAQYLLGSKGKRSARSRQWFQAERLKGIASYYLGENSLAAEYLTNAATGLRKLMENSEGGLKNIYLYDLAECLNDLGLTYISAGKMLSSQKAYQECLDIHKRIHSNLGAISSARNNVAYLHHQVGHYSDAWKEYSMALENAKSINRVREQIAILNGRGELLLDLEETEEALANFQTAIQLGNQFGERPELVASYLGMSKIEKIRGQHQEAMSWLRKAASFTANPLSNAEYQVELGSVYASMGQHDLALQQFRTVLAKSNGNSPSQNEVLAAFLAARSLFRTDKLEKAKPLFSEALAGAAQLGYDQFLVTASRSSMDLLEAVIHSSPTPQAKSLFERANAFRPGKLNLDVGSHPEKAPDINIEVRAFGAGEIRVNGELLPSSVWRSSRARGLFFYILDRGKARKETIGLEFWPDFSAGKISSNFHATLWRVRQALGFKDAILFQGDQYSFHPSIHFWYDVAEFERYIRSANKPGISDPERSEILKQAVTLYQDPYLQDLYMEWADHRREELRNTFLETLSKLAAIESDAKRFVEAKKIYERIVGIDPYRDEAHLSLMKCLALSGASSAAIAHFKRYKSILRKELNSEPLPELQEYYNTLTKQS